MRRKKRKIKKPPKRLQKCKTEDCVMKWAESREGHKWAGFDY